MSEYRLYCFAKSGNAYRAALMLSLIGADWEPVFVDYFGKAEQRSAEWRADLNEMGEVPVLVHGERTLTQSGVILAYLAERSGKFRPEGEEQQLEALRWILFDTHKLNGLLGPYRAMKSILKPPGDPVVLDFLKRRFDNALAILARRLEGRSFILGERPTIADIALTAYLYYPPEEFGFDLAEDHPAIGRWLGRIRALPGWAHPYDLMPGRR